jgi:hypothetical protein
VRGTRNKKENKSLTGLKGLKGLISNPAISPRRSEAVGNPQNPVNPVEKNLLCVSAPQRGKVIPSFIPGAPGGGLINNFKRINASLSAFAEWFPLRSNEPYCAKRIRLSRLRFRHSPNSFRFAPTSLIA